MSRLSNARTELENYEKTRPADYVSQYQPKIKDVMGQLDGMKDFSYDPTRDAAYEQYKNSYTRQAKLANENAQANASAISGGYGSSYGTQAGQSAYQNAMAGLRRGQNCVAGAALQCAAATAQHHPPALGDSVVGQCRVAFRAPVA